MPIILVRQGQLGVNRIKEPLKRLAAETLSQLHPLCYIAKVPPPQIRPLLVVELLVFIHPYFNETKVVLGQRLPHPSGEGVRILRTKDVPHV